MTKQLKVLTLLFFITTVLLSSCTKDESELRGQITYIGAITGIEYYADGARVYLVNSTTDENYTSTTTDASGNYQFYPVPDGSYYIDAEITVNGIDYWELSSEFFVEKDDVKTVDLILKEE